MTHSTSLIRHIVDPVVPRSKAWVYRCMLAGIAGSNTAGGMDVGLL